MAEKIGIEVYLGMDANELQSELQKSENLLREFQTQLKKSTNTIEINMLNQEIGKLNGTISNMKTALGSTATKTGDATQALTNLSRVAQDAPYGFMGIANNLNPLLESFQQLSKNSKDSGGALKALGQGLIGPAGIGLALGVASSLIVKFGDDIQKFITEKAVGLGKAFTKESEIITTGVDAFVKARLEIVELNNEFTNYTNGVSTKEEFLKKFNATLGDTVKETKDLATAEKFLSEYADEYVQMTFKKAIANEAAAQAAKKQVEAEIAKNKPTEAFKGVGDFTTIFFGGTIEGIKNVAKARQNTIVTEAQKDVSILETIRVKYQNEANKIQAELRKVFGAPEIKDPEKAKFQKAVDAQKKILDKQFNKIKEGFGTKKDEQIVDAYIKPKAKTPEQISPTGSFYDQVEKDNMIAANRIMLVKEQTQAYRDMADTVSNYATNALMGLWSSMEQGMNIGEALGAMFTDLAKQIAAAAIKALVFKAILAAFSGGSSEAAAASTGAGSFFSIFKTLLGLPVTKNANGGITNGPSWGLIGEAGPEAILPLSKLGSLMNSTFNAGAMSGGAMASNGQFVLRGNDLVLALQRSNYSLNLRRGA